MGAQASQQLITLDMTLEQIVNTYPQTVPILGEAGVGCVGCHASTFEMLGDGLRGHGMGEEEVNLMLKKLNEAAGSSRDAKLEGGAPSGHGDGPVIELTAAAVEKTKELLKKEKKEGWGLRVGVLPGGCSGFTYDLGFDKQAQEGDSVVEKDGLKIFVDADSLQFIQGAKMDFVDSLQGSGFKIDNPNASSGCGCGKSFG